MAITKSVGGEKADLQIRGFRPCPKELIDWQHGNSTENDFIYVTTQTLTRERLAKLSEEVGEKRSLLIC